MTDHFVLSGVLSNTIVPIIMIMVRGLSGESACPWGDFILDSPSWGAN